MIAEGYRERSLSSVQKCRRLLPGYQWTVTDVSYKQKEASL